jgi:hypothetical protein
VGVHLIDGDREALDDRIAPGPLRRERREVGDDGADAMLLCEMRDRLARIASEEGIFFFARSSSTSTSPRSMNPYCRMAAPRNSSAREKTTPKGDPLFSASSWAKVRAQLSSALWSLLIQ